MESDARSAMSHRLSSWSLARRQGEATLLRLLECTMSVEDDATRRALHAFVEALVDEGLTPEAAVIALKEALGRAHYLYRFEPLVREHLRTSLVSECIDHYFIALGTDHLIPPARASMSLEHAPERARRNDAETSR
jgi:hypothetical protein